MALCLFGACAHSEDEPAWSVLYGKRATAVRGEGTECRLSKDGAEVCGYHCRTGQDGRAACASAPAGSCRVDEKGHAVCDAPR